MAAWVSLGAVVLGCAGTTIEAPDYSNVPKWTTRALPEARGDFRVGPDGKRAAIRYRGWTTRDFGAFRTYAYDDTRPEPPVQKAALPAGVTGDPKKGRALFMNRAKGPCTGCHLIPGDDGYTLVDSGWNTPEAFAALEGELRELNI